MRRDGFALVDEGNWAEICTFLEEFSDVVTHIVPSDAHERFEDWRPDREEDRSTFRERSAEADVMAERSIERHSDGLHAEFQQAGGWMREGGREFVHGHPGVGVRDVGHAGNSAARGIVPLLFRLVRGVERGIYRHIIGRTSPQYFEDVAFSVSVERSAVNGRYTARIVFPGSELLDYVAKRMDA